MKRDNGGRESEEGKNWREVERVGKGGRDREREGGKERERERGRERERDGGRKKGGQYKEEKGERGRGWREGGGME